MTRRADATAPAAPWEPRLLATAERRRLMIGRSVDPDRRATRGQFLTPPPIAALLASLFELRPGPGALLDPGAGVGSLSAAFADRWARETTGPLAVTAVEIEELFLPPLRATLGDIERAGMPTDLVEGDFIRWAVERSMTALPLFGSPSFDYVVMNPPYRKVSAGSVERRLTQALGLEINNLYTAFLALGTRLLNDGGQLVAITPRSFANGPYFRAFRRDFLDQMSFRRIHIYDARDDAFSDADVLQENVIIHAVKESASPSIAITSSSGANDETITIRSAACQEVVADGDPDTIIHLSTDEIGAGISRRMRRLRSSLARNGLSVSTGRVVEFRAREYLADSPAAETVPLIFPTHLTPQARIAWPSSSRRKPNAIVVAPETRDLLIRNGTYVLVKRFSAKEERRRIVAAISDASMAPGEYIGFENHLNVFHRNGEPLEETLAKGLAAFLNSTVVDLFFRQWSGHTQVNATDLRRLPYPTEDELVSLGRAVGDLAYDQPALDRLVSQHVPNLGNYGEKMDVLMAHQRILDAQDVLRELGLPKAQTNERSALTLLALLGLRPDKSWADVEAPLLGITPMMDFMAEHYGKRYAPNSRETVRRQTVHQFVAAGIARRNPDDPQRPTNSGKTVYQVPDRLVGALRHYGSEDWDDARLAWLREAPALRDRWAREREMNLIPVALPSGEQVMLTPGGQNPLVRAIIEDFCPRFIQQGRLLYMGDTAEKFAVWERDALGELGVSVDEHGKMPDVVVLDQESNWLVLIEAVTSHGPMDAKRREELASLFANSTAGLVYVTAFLDRTALGRFLDVISWETEVWVAETPTHMIHFDGERFLGPYDPD